MSEEKKLEQLSEKLADKEDEQDMLFEKITESFRESIDFIGDYAREGLDYLEDAESANHFEEGVASLENVADEIRHLSNILGKNEDNISRLTALEEEIEELEKKI